ncbi:MAG: hypothetical protein OHK0013_15110 [Sandaracinaceae bacterium]|jgi:excisionase family DNA binding protein
MLIDADARLLTKREVARWLKIAPQTVVRMARRGDLPGRRVGNRWRFVQAEIRQWLLAGGRS